MSKRVSLSERREQDRRGVDKVFFDSPATPKAAPAKKAKPAAPKREASNENGNLIKATYYIRDGQDDTLVDVQRAIKKQTGEKRDKSDLIREAIELLAKKYGA